MKIIFYRKYSGRSPIDEFIASLSIEAKAELFDMLSLLEQGKNLSMPHSRALSSVFHGLHELRIRDSAGQIRFLYFIRPGSGIYILHAFRKARRNLARLDIELAIKRIKEI